MELLAICPNQDFEMSAKYFNSDDISRISDSLNLMCNNYIYSENLVVPNNTVNIPEDLYRRPVVVAAVRVFSSSSTPLPHDRRTPNPEYMTANTPNVLAVAAPCFITFDGIA
uniref:Uncharacterized protein n=2 Tax=Timema TaxID=61471 RepID=A0A7R9ESG1_9NEOP|nr:unnamed protein product [Timema bartmani]